MINHPAFTVEPWCLRATDLDLTVLAQAESVFALANGHIGWRGNLDEGEPHGLPGSYLNGVYELRPMPYAEAGYGYPESGQTVINVTNGKLIRLLVDDEPFDVRYGELRAHERCLDFRAGVLHRTANWVSPAGRAIRVSSTRLVSFVQRSIAAIRYDVEPLDDPVRVVVQSELVANEQLPAPGGDPRAAAALGAPLVEEADAAKGARAGLVHSTRHSGLCIAAVMDHVVSGPAATEVQAESFPHLGRVTVTAALEPGQRLRLVKFVAYGWSEFRSLPAVRDQADAALAEAKRVGWEGLLAGQRAYLDAFWNRADVQLDGDAEIQQAVRFALFHVLQAGARAEGRAIAAKGLTGPGYDGHCFWDTESYVLPVLTYVAPETVAHALRWRHSTMPLAAERAARLGLRGAAFPWRTIHGEGCSGYWPAGMAAFHVNADIADAVIRYLGATGDEAFERTVGLALLTKTARLWRSLGHHDGQGLFRIDGVTGPDEYSAIADNNVSARRPRAGRRRPVSRRRRRRKPLAGGSFQPVIEFLGHPVPQFGEQRLDVQARHKRAEKPREAAQLVDIADQRPGRARILDLDGNLAPVVPDGPVRLADGGCGRRFVVELGEAGPPLLAHVAREYLVNCPGRQRRRGILQPGQGGPVRFDDLRGERRPRISDSACPSFIAPPLSSPRTLKT